MDEREPKSVDELFPPRKTVVEHIIHPGWKIQVGSAIFGMYLVANGYDVLGATFLVYAIVGRCIPSFSKNNPPPQD